MERQDKIFKGRRIFHKVGEGFKRQGNWIGRIRFARQERSQEGRRFGRQEKFGKKHKRPQTQILNNRHNSDSHTHTHTHTHKHTTQPPTHTHTHKHTHLHSLTIPHTQTHTVTHTHTLTQTHTYTDTPIHYTQIQRSTLWRKQIYKQASTRMRTHMYTQTRIHFFYKQPE